MNHFRRNIFMIGSVLKLLLVFAYVVCAYYSNFTRGW